MNKLLKTVILTLTATCGLMFIPVSAYAVNVLSPVCDGSNGINESAVCRDGASGTASNPIVGPNGVLTIAINIISIIVAIVATIIIIIAALRFLTSQGNPQSVSTARNQIIYAVVGLVVAGIAQGVVAFVLKRIK